MSRVAGPLLAICLLVFFAETAQASPVLFSGTGTSSGVTLSASANFAISGSVLTVTLRNTGDSTGVGTTDLINNQLTGLFFDLPSGFTLTPSSAAITAGTIVQASTCSAGATTCNGATNVGAEFWYRNSTFTGHDGDNGIASAGYIGSGTSFGGSNLDNNASGNDINFAIIAPRTAANPFVPGSGITGEPLIDGPVVFRLNIVGTGTLTESQISNVSFQYGRYLSDTHFYGFAGSSSSQSVPEPALLFIAGPALALAARRMRRALK